MAKNKKKLKLVLPNKKYHRSFLRGLKEARNEKKSAMQFKSSFDLADKKVSFAVYQKRMKDSRYGINLKKGRVPQTLYWAVVDNKFVGILKLRHKLNKYLRDTAGGNIGYVVIPSERRKGYATEMLRLGLEKAKKLGIKKVMLGCWQDNIASQKVIEKNGGVLNKRFKMKGRNTLRYFIDNK